MGMLHLEIKRHRMERDFNLKVRVGKPYVSFRETLREKKEAKGGVARMETYIDVELRPVQSDTPALPVVRETSDFPEIPAALREAARQGVAGALQSGELGFPVINVEARITGYTLNEQLSNDIAVQGAARRCRQQGIARQHRFARAGDAFGSDVARGISGPVTADLNARRAEIGQLLIRGKLRMIEAYVPLRAMFDYSDKVRSLSQGRAGWTMAPHTYAPAPNEVLQGLLGQGLD